MKNFSKFWYCKILGRHNMILLKNLSYDCQKIKCVRCKKQFAVNHRLRVVLSWNSKFENFYKMYGELIKSIER